MPMAAVRWVTPAAALLGLDLLGPGAGSSAQEAAPAARNDSLGDPLPPGARARLGTVWLRHDHYGSSTADFSPDGKTLVTEGKGVLHFWDAVTGKLLREIREDYGGILFSPDCRWIALVGRVGGL